MMMDSDSEYEFEYKEYLQELFPNKSMRTIHDAIDSVLRRFSNYDPEYQLDCIIDILTEAPDEPCPGPGSGSHEDGLKNEATGVSRKVSELDLETYFEQILTIFPDACPSYVRNLCYNRLKSFINLDTLIDDMTKVDYPKKEISPKAVFHQLKEMLPHADPRYLQEQAEILAFKSEIDLKHFLEDAIINAEYPTMDTYLKYKKETEEIDRYTINFDIEQFLRDFPDPEGFFYNPNRKSPLVLVTQDVETDTKQKDYALNFLFNSYPYLRKKIIEKVFEVCTWHLREVCTKLDGIRKSMRTPRGFIPIDKDKVPHNIPLLQEIAFLKNRKLINTILKEIDVKHQLAKEEAKRYGFLETCQCCFDEELIPEECYFCKKGCVFCKSCVKKGAEHVIGEDRLDFRCLAECGSEFSVSTLQMVLAAHVFSCMVRKMQADEVKKANIDGLETCPFCDFATIPSPDDKIFHCLNSECMKESCRKCRHVSHIPQKCEEIEYDDDIKMRTYIENQMTEALLRKCWKCYKVFIKISGCNRMTCFCGASICYVCGEPVQNYEHFTDDDGDLTRCPLHTHDLKRFHIDQVVKGAAAAKKHLGVDENPNKLKFDPSKGIETFY